VNIRTLVKPLLVILSLLTFLPSAFGADEGAPTENSRDPASKHKHGKKKHHKKKHKK
jgi:hypothetical protein